MTDFFLELEKNARRFPGSPAIVSRTGHVSYGYLAGSIESVAAAAAAAGIAPGQTILLNCLNNEARFPLVLGLLRLGVTLALGVKPATFAEHNVRFDAMVSDNPRLRGNFKIIRPTPQWFKVESTGKAVTADRPDYAMIFSSTGSTGTPRLIKFDRNNFEYRIGNKFDDVYFSDCPRSFLAAGPMTAITIIDTIAALKKCGVVIQHTVRSPVSILDSINLFKPDYVCMAPSALVNVLELLRDKPRKLEKVDYLRLTGSYCSIETREKALEIFAEDIITSYGVTEIGRVAWSRLADICDTEGSVGRIIDGMSVETVDDDGNALASGSEGEIRIKPPKAAPASYVTAGGEQSALRDGWFYPGDLGRVDADGNLIITGRKSTVINLGGNKVSPEFVESLLGKMEAIADVGVLGVKGPNGFDAVCAVVVQKKNVNLEEINAQVSAQSGRFRVRELRFAPAIPRTANGKIDRIGLKELAS